MQAQYSGRIVPLMGLLNDKYVQAYTWPSIAELYSHHYWFRAVDPVIQLGDSYLDSYLPGFALSKIHHWDF